MEIYENYILEDYCWNHLLGNEDAKLCWCSYLENPMETIHPSHCHSFCNSDRICFIG